MDSTESIRRAAALVFADALAAWRGARGVCARLGAWRARGPAYRDAHVPAALPRLLAPYVRHQVPTPTPTTHPRTASTSAEAYHLADRFLFERFNLFQLILWNPLADEDNEDYEKMDWYK